jgi:hypothetical protein
MACGAVIGRPESNRPLAPVSTLGLIAARWNCGQRPTVYANSVELMLGLATQTLDLVFYSEFLSLEFGDLGVAT